MQSKAQVLIVYYTIHSDHVAIPIVNFETNLFKKKKRMQIM